MNSILNYAKKDVTPPKKLQQKNSVLPKKPVI